MASSRSGFIIEVPLGLWSSIEFTFVEADDDSFDISHVEAHLVDDSGKYEVPAQLSGFVSAYVATWLVQEEEGHFVPASWVGNEFWQEQTTDRLATLATGGQARRITADD